VRAGAAAWLWRMTETHGVTTKRTTWLVCVRVALPLAGVVVVLVVTSGRDDNAKYTMRSNMYI